IEIGLIEHVPERPRRPRPVVAAAAVDENLLEADLQQPAVHAELDEVLFGVVVIWRHPVRVRSGDRRVVFRKNIARAVDRQVGFLDARDADLADRKYRHVFPRGVVAGLVPATPNLKVWNENNRGGRDKARPRPERELQWTSASGTVAPS